MPGPQHIQASGKESTLDARPAMDLGPAICADDEEAAPLLMQYNDPFTPPWKRRNEVAIPVRRREAETA